VLKTDYGTPGAILILPVDPAREDWLKARFEGVGTSDIATLTGANKYSNPYTLWVEKTERVLTDEPTEAMWWGTNTEALTAQRFEEITGIETRRIGTLQSKKNPRHLANIDRLTADGGILEIKDHETLSDAGKTVQKGEITGHAYAQLQWGMHVSGRSKAWFAAKVGKTTHVIGPISRDEAFIENAIRLADTFWGQVETVTPPPVDFASVTDEELAQRFNTVDLEATVEAAIPELALDDLAELEEVKAQQAELKERRDAIERRIKAQIGDKEYLTVNGQPVARWQPVTSKRWDSKAFKADHPELDAQYRKESVSRRFSTI